MIATFYWIHSGPAVVCRLPSTVYYFQFRGQDLQTEDQCSLRVVGEALISDTET
jgi:hypothetical protein